MKICHINIRSLTAHYGDFLEYLEGRTYDVIALSETWLHEGIYNGGLSINGYSLVRRDRSNNCRGGGVAFYINKTIKFSVVTEHTNLEELWIVIKNGMSNIAMGCIYRPPNMNCNIFLDEFESSLMKISTLYDSIACLGDFNIDMLNVSAARLRFNNILESMVIQQIVDFPTRVAGNSSSLLDLLLISESIKYKDCTFDDVSDISDHFLVKVELIFNYENLKVKPTYYRNYKNINSQQLVDDFQSIPWRNIYNLDNVDDKVEFLNTNLQILLDLHAPLKLTTFRRKSKPYITDTIKILIDYKNKCQRRYKRTKNPGHIEIFRRVKNFANNTIAQEKKAFLRYNSNNNNAWETLKKLNIYSKSKIPDIPEFLNDVNKINDFFVNSVPNLTPSQRVESFYQESKIALNSDLKFDLITDNDISKLLLSIRTKAVGSDGLNISFILMCCPGLIEYITHIVNASIESSVFPKLWKSAHVVPHPKSDTVSNYKDLRPISILPVVSKLIEKVLKMQLVAHLNNNNILPNTQSGFVRGHGCATALLNVTDNIFSCI